MEVVITYVDEISSTICKIVAAASNSYKATETEMTRIFFDKNLLSMSTLRQRHDIAWCLQQDVLFCSFLRSQSERLIETRITASFNVGNLSVGLVYPNTLLQIKQINLKRTFSLHEGQDCSQRSHELRQCSIEFVCLSGAFISFTTVQRRRFLTDIFLL